MRPKPRGRAWPQRERATGVRESGASSGEGAPECRLGIGSFQSVNPQSDPFVHSGSDIHADVDFTGIKPTDNLDAGTNRTPAGGTVDMETRRSRFGHRNGWKLSVAKGTGVKPLPSASFGSFGITVLTSDQDIMMTVYRRNASILTNTDKPRIRAMRFA